MNLKELLGRHLLVTGCSQSHRSERKCGSGNHYARRKEGLKKRELLHLESSKKNMKEKCKDFVTRTYKSSVSQSLAESWYTYESRHSLHITRPKGS